MTRRSLARIALFLVLALAVAPAFADTGAAPPTETTPLGVLLIALVSVGGLAITGAFTAGAIFFARKAKDGAMWSLLNRLWVVAQQAVTHAEAEIRPSIQKALSDGKLTPEEGAELKAKATAIFKTMAGDLLKQLPKVAGFSEEGIGAFVSGLIERAVSVMKLSPAVSTEINRVATKIPPAPLPAAAKKAVEAARANPPAASADELPPSP